MRTGLLNDEDFNDDTKDAGEMGSGHMVTALYEIVSCRLRRKDPVRLIRSSTRFHAKLQEEDFSDEF